MHSGYLSFANGCNCHPDDIFPFILKTTAIFTSPFTKRTDNKKDKDNDKDKDKDILRTPPKSNPRDL